MKAAAQRKMKPSGIDWIGDVPEGWSVGRVKHYYNIQLGKMLTSEPEAPTQSLERYYCAGDVHFGSVNETDLKEMWFDRGEKITYEVEIGDLLVVEGGAGAGGAAIVRTQNVRTFIQNSIMRLRAEREADNGFLSYWIESLTRGGYVDLVCNKATIPHFTKQKLGVVPLPLPPLDEQKRIAAKLDRLCGLVDELAENIKGEIAALQEYRKSLITECVTKGLNPKAKMKPSGVDWIGDIPEKWTVMRTKYVSRVQTGPFGTQLSADSYTEDGSGVPCVNVKNIGDGVFRVDDLDRVQEDVAERLVNYVIKRGDVIFARKGSVDKRTVAEDEQDGWILGSDSIGVRFDEDVMPRYACYYYGNGVMGQHLHKMAKGSTMPSMNAETIGNLEIIIPPFGEQKRIAAFLDKRCAVIDAKIAERQKQLEKLGEYRSSVIYEYVTGKREVSA